MTNFAAVLNDLAATFEGRNEYISSSAAIRCLFLMILEWSVEQSTA